MNAAQARAARALAVRAQRPDASAARTKPDDSMRTGGGSPDGEPTRGTCGGIRDSVTVLDRGGATPGGQRPSGGCEAATIAQLPYGYRPWGGDTDTSGQYVAGAGNTQ